jgi:hypothetical protein
MGMDSAVPYFTTGQVCYQSTLYGEKGSNGRWREGKCGREEAMGDGERGSAGGGERETNGEGSRRECTGDGEREERGSKEDEGMGGSALYTLQAKLFLRRE